ncbi:hypothetical protein [Streptomyces avermitilis]|uniref:hypothetical protein n=1 Tax=Streptomyces avermitilis TaxID=33903 RepID=UPI00367E41D3
MSRPTAAPESRDRAYFVVGQWKGGGDVDVWHVEEPPADPTLNVFENKEAFLFCNYDRSKALCHPGRGTKSAAPSLDRCKVNCANIARTDTHAHQLRQAADDLGRQVASGLVPEPLADRLRERAQVLTELAHQHDHDRVMAAAGTEL